MNYSIVIQRLNFLNEISNSIVSSLSQEEAINTALDQIHKLLDVQVASLFLFSKNGVIKRVAIKGHDKSGKPIPNQWLPNEQYLPKESFTGRPVPETGLKPTENNYGKPEYSNNIHNEFPDLKYGNEYVDMLGALNCGIAVPINGIHRTIGVLEVLNRRGGSIFSELELYDLILASTTLANFISNFTSQRRLASFNNTVEAILNMETNNSFEPKNIDKVLGMILDVLISDLTAYKVVVLRLAEDSFLSEAKVLATRDIDLAARDNSSIPFGSGIAGSVYNDKKAMFITEIRTECSSYNNREWIIANNLCSHACVPLTINATTVGTLSVYTGYKHYFTQSNKAYLKSMSWLLASILYLSKSKKKLYLDQQNLDRQRSEFYRKTYSMSYDTRLDDLLHRFKDDLIDFSYNLNQALQKNNTEKNKIIREQISLMDIKTKEISLQFSAECSIKPTNLNLVIRHCADLFDLNNKQIEISFKLARDLPVIIFEETKLKIIIHNIISNAVDAIEKARPKLGQIYIESEVLNYEQRNLVEVRIQDNGCGIPNELKDKIYLRGFTTRKSENGTGLGLFLVRELLTSHGGKIYFDSTVGKGTTWHIRFPLDLISPSENC
jgi:GAF domain-containing protein